MSRWRCGRGLVVGGHGVLEVEHDRVGAAGQRLAESFRPRAGHEEVGASGRAAIGSGMAQPQTALERAGRRSRPRCSRAPPGSRRCARRAQAPDPCAGRCPRYRAAASRAPGPLAVPTSVQRPRALSCGCAHTSFMVLTWALAICASSSRSTTCAPVSGWKASTMIWRNATRSAHALEVGGEARVRGELGLLQHLVAEAHPFALVLQAQHHGRAVAGGNGP